MLLPDLSLPATSIARDLAAHGPAPSVADHLATAAADHLAAHGPASVTANDLAVQNSAAATAHDLSTAAAHDLAPGIANHLAAHNSAAAIAHDPAAAATNPLANAHDLATATVDHLVTAAHHLATATATATVATTDVGVSPGGIFGAQPNPAVWVPLVTGGIALLLVLSGAPWRFARNIVTIVHEAGHALVAVLAGRRLQGIQLHSDTSGVTLSRGRSSGPGMVLTALAGYPAPALLGLGFAALVAANRVSVLLVVAALLLLGVLVMVRNAYGVLSVVVTAIGLGVIAFVAGSEVQFWFVYLITWFLLFAGLRPVFELQAKRRRGAARDSDADQLARLTGVPGGLWILILVVVALTCLVVGGAWLLEPALQS